MNAVTAPAETPVTTPDGLVLLASMLYRGLAKLDASGQQLPSDATDHAIVYDPITGLMEAVRAEGFDQAFTHDEAVTAVAALRHAGYSDWAIPSVPEAVHSVDYTREEPAADPSLYPDTDSTWYWTAQQTKWTEGEAGSSRSFFCVGLSYGLVYHGYADVRLRVRPVRRASPASQCLLLGH